MKWTPGTQNDDVVDVRDDSNASGGGGGGGGGFGLGGGGGGSSGGGGFGGIHLGVGGTIVVAIIFVIIKFVGSGSHSTTTTATSNNSRVTSGNSTAPGHPRDPKTDPDAKLVDFIKFTMKDIQDTFDAKFKEMGKSYTHAKLYIFTSVIDTACGRSSSEIGPFYCPGDNHAYIDLSFYRELRDRFGAPGEFAEAYVLAHELGHHVQNLLGIDAKASRMGHDKKSRNAVSVRQELQADCFAGVWGNSAKSRNILDPGDLEQALTAAAAIGDDRLEKQAGIPVDAETWTHGSSAQRTKWFRRGFDSGKFDQCDTFSATDL